MILCDYGCNNEGLFLLKNGKYCCNNHWSKCNKLKEKNRIGVKKSYKEGRIVTSAENGYHGWCKGLTKESDSRVLKGSLKFKEGIKSGRIIHSWVGKKHKEETKLKIRKYALENSNEKNLKRNRNNFYINDSFGKEVQLQSSYELKVSEYLNQLNIKWVRPFTPFLYIDKENITRKYYPDFYLLDFNVYLDPKNSYLLIKDKHKLESASIRNNIKIIPVKVTDIKNIELFKEFLKINNI